MPQSINRIQLTGIDNALNRRKDTPTVLRKVGTSLFFKYNKKLVF